MATEAKTPKPTGRKVADAPQTNPSLNLYQRIRAVMADVAYLNKDKQVGDGGYSYKAVSEESVTGTVREKMIKHGLVLFPVSQTHRHEELPRVDRYGKDTITSLSTVDVTYKLANVDDMSQFELICSSGTGVDPQDKGVGKAMTYAFKYALLRLFAIPTGNDPDAVHNDELARQQETAAPGKQPAGAAAPASLPLAVSTTAARAKLAELRSKLDLTDLWNSLSEAARLEMKDEFTAARLRIEAAIAEAIKTPLPQRAVGITAPANRPATDATGIIYTYATAEQKLEVVRLANHPKISRPEKTAVVLRMNHWSEDLAAAKLDWLQSSIDEREGYDRAAGLRRSLVGFAQQHAAQIGPGEVDRLTLLAEDASMTLGELQAEMDAAREALTEVAN